MQQYKPIFLAASLLLIIGAISPTSGEKELIIKLQGEVLVLQRQVRDLQESFDKWQGQSAASLQKISENTDTTVREISSVEDSLKNVQSFHSSNLAGTSVQLQKISEHLSRQNQNLSSLSQQMSTLRQSIQEFQQKLESKERSERVADPSTTQNSPESLFATAYSQYNKGNYESAISFFRAYLNSQSQGEDIDDAIFWIAESLFSLDRHNEAIREYDRILSEFPKGDKATQALLKKGITLLHLERRNEGVTILKSVINQFPNSTEASTARNELSRLGEVSSTSSALPPQNRQRPM
ncbi:MAG: tetratricopeptide repeat protein [Acidobacteria bacterium]|nr:tetratricopeptide repeat protein [Acidobacteriota bacterium]